MNITPVTTFEASEFGISDLSLHLAGDFKKSILVSTREVNEKNTRVFLPNEFPPSHDDEVVTQFAKGATLIIDAQPVHFEGRIFPTIKPEAALELAKAGMDRFAGLLAGVLIICHKSHAHHFASIVTTQPAHQGEGRE